MPTARRKQKKWNHEKHELHERKKQKFSFLNKGYFRVFGVFRGWLLWMNNSFP
jgi:hypothetical protein